MASSSSMCGPSNALQNLQKHASADKTLQQDRLLRRPRSAASFRSSPAPGASPLEAEFEQFSGIPQIPHLQHSASPSPQSFLRHAPAPPRQHMSPQPPPVAMDGWANDFLNLNIAGSPASSSTSSIAQQKAPARPRSSHHMQPQQQQQPIQQGVGMGSWASDFMQQPHQPLMAGSPMVGQLGMPYGGGMLMGGQQHQFGSLAQGTGGIQTDAGAQFSDQDFDRMFEEAQIAAGIQAEDVIQGSASNQVGSLEQQATPREAVMPVVEPMVEEKEEKPMEEQEDSDELARTAGQLLDTLSTNTSQKFKESNFLALMRKLRDHEVRIEGGKMVEVELPIRGDADIGAFPEGRAYYDSFCFGTKVGRSNNRKHEWERLL